MNELVVNKQLPCWEILDSCHDNHNQNFCIADNYLFYFYPNVFLYIHFHDKNFGKNNGSGFPFRIIRLNNV